jgi:DNA helicase IV
LASDEIDREQEYLSMLYGRLDRMRAAAVDRRSTVLLESGGTQQARSERESRATLYTDRIAQFDAVENGLCFGRLDLDDGERRYIGRLGIFDTDADYEPLLLDWRAAAARPFYLATAASPEGVRRRRYLRTEGRRVVGLEDEVLDLAAAAQLDRPTGVAAGLAGEAVLLAAVNANRTGHMRDIVETIQADQDRVIRSPQEGVLVVEGGPGTGKTAVALHRAAYLLYTHREQLTKRGVLIVGPNPTFLRYIERVLPSLGETSVLLATVGELYPGVRAERDEPAETARRKGDLAMVEVVAAAVQGRQRVPDEPIEVGYEGGSVVLEPSDVERARGRARRARLPHNQARALFVDAMLDALARQVADRMRDDVLSIDVPEIDPAMDPFINEEVPAGELFDAEDVAVIRAELAGEPAVHAALDELWPALTPQRLLADFFACPGPGLEDLYRPQGTGWTVADVPLLDEAAELLGEDDRAARARAAREERERIAYAQGVLDILDGSALLDTQDESAPEFLTAKDVLVAADLAERHDRGDGLTAAQRAAADRNWAYGHVIVDEAQELSAMAWRMLMRRCPSRSMTIVGDVAQTGDPAGADSWQAMLEPYVAQRWRLARLTVNYRTPTEVMALAAAVLAEIDPDRQPPRSVRETGVAPWRREVAPAELAEQVARAAVAERVAVGDGRLAVLVPASRLDEIGQAVRAAVPDVGIGGDARLERSVVILTVRQAKGLEFDSVLVADPARILAESPRGLGDLYVGLTRTTQRLGVLHAGPVPQALASMDFTPDSQVLPRTAC